MDPADAWNPWRWDATRMNAAWLQGVRDLLDQVLGARGLSPLGQRVANLPTALDLDNEDLTADDVLLQGRPGGIAVNPGTYPPPQYGGAIQAAIYWLRGETTISPVDQDASSPYHPSQQTLA
jgi:hypothetical protein